MVVFPSYLFTPVVCNTNPPLPVVYPPYNPNDVEYYNDPVTGAPLVRPRTVRTHYLPTPLPTPTRCSLPDCVYAGHVHSFCVPRFSASPARSSRRQSPSNRPSFRINDPAEETAYWLWQSTRPNWQLPRQMPPGWKRPGAPFPNFPSTTIPTGVVGGPGTPYPTTHTHRRSTSAPESQSLGRPMYWENLNAGGASASGGVGVGWAPYSWVPHPYPYPGIPAEQFWNTTLPVPWWSPDPRLYQLTPWHAPQGVPTTVQPAYYLSGGWPLPGADPYWTPGAWNPDRWRDEPQQDPNSLRLAPWLIPNPRNGAIPHILWDVTEDPRLMKRISVRGTLSRFAESSSFDDRATEPSMREIKIHLPYMHPSWGPVVARSSTAVKCSHIFYAIYQYLQTPLTRDDVHDLLATTGGRDKLDRMEYSAYRRCQSAVIPDRERLDGIKRVDVLEGATVFWGMWPSYNEDGTWHLNVGFCPPMSWENQR